MEFALEGKRALVYASSRGLGYACALGLAKEDCDLVITSRDQARVDHAAEHWQSPSTTPAVRRPACDGRAVRATTAGYTAQQIGR